MPSLREEVPTATKKAFLLAKKACKGNTGLSLRHRLDLNLDLDFPLWYGTEYKLHSTNDISAYRTP